MDARGAGETLMITRGEVVRLLDLDRCITAVENAFRLLGEGRAGPPAIMGVEVEGGGFHTKGGVLSLERAYFAAKTNANFPGNRARFGLPTVQGTIVLHDAESGAPLAVLDSIAISILRTGAATAVAARHLARADARAAAVLGCGEQGRVQLRALARVLPLERAWLFDVVRERSERLAAEMELELGFEVRPVDDPRAAIGEAEVCVTCTPSREYLVGREDVHEGTFVAGVGVDSPQKRELHPSLLAASTVVADLLEQCATIGDLHHALEAGVLAREDVHAELGAVVAGLAPGRTREDEITVFDSTGMALQDVAAAALVYERALEAGVGTPLDLMA